MCSILKAHAGEFSDGLAGWGSCILTTVALVAIVRHRFNPWPRNSHILPVWPKRKKKKKKNTTKNKTKQERT